MAMSLGALSSFLPSQTTSLVRRSSTVRLVPASLRTVKTVTLVAASKSAEENNKRGGKSVLKPLRVSPELQAFLGGVSEITLTQALLEIAAYIKQHGLSDPARDHIIICDENLKKIFGGRDRFDFIQIAGLITPHFPQLVELRGMESQLGETEFREMQSQFLEMESWEDDST